MPYRALRALAVLAAVGSLAMIPPAHAGDTGTHAAFSVGRSTTSGQRWTNAAFVDVTTATHDFRHVHWQPAFTLGWIDGRVTTYDDLHHDVFVGAAGIRLVDWWRSAFFSFQIGAADGHTDAISSTTQFVSTLGWQRRHWQIMVRHISNGDFFGGKNLGETMLLVGVRL